MKRTPSDKLEKLQKLAKDGLPDRVISERLVLSLHTVRFYRRFSGLRRAASSGRLELWISPTC